MLKITVYSLPDGKKSEIELANIAEEDANFFVENGLSVSIEELTTQELILYSTTGVEGGAGEEIEEIYIVPSGEESYTSMKNLRSLVEKSWERG